MKKLLLAFLLLLIVFPVYAQTVAQNVQPGYLTITSCPGGSTPCYKASTNPVNSGAGEASHVFKNTPGVLYGFSATTGASSGYVLVFNATSAPSDGSVTPVGCYAIGANSTIGIAYTPLPLNLTTGITIVFSTTGCFTQTKSATAFFLGEVL